MKILYAAAIAAALLIHSSAFADLYPKANEKGKFGYTDDSGVFVIQPQYDDAQPFFQGKAIVRKGSSFGVIDEQNKPVLPLKYNLIDPVDDNTFMVAVDGKIKDGHLVGEKYGFISSSGQTVLPPEFVEMSPFNQFGLAAIRHKNGKCGFIDRSYRFVIPAEFDFTGSFNDNGVVWLNKGGRPDQDGDIAGGKFYIVDAQGNMFIPGEHASIGYFAMNNWKPSQQWLNSLGSTYKRLWSEGNPSYYHWKKYYFDLKPGSRIPVDAVGYWSAPTKEGYGNGVFDTSGMMLVQPGKYYSVLMPENGVAVVCPKKDHYNYLNVNTGQFILTKDIDNAFAFQDGYGVCTVGKKMFIVNAQGAATSLGFDVIYPYADGMHIVTDNGLFGIIDHDGHEIIPCSAPDIWPIKDGLAIVKVGSSFAFAGKNGYATPACYTKATNFLHGYAWADDGNGWHLYDTSFRKITKEPVASGAYNKISNLFWAKDKTTDVVNFYNISDGSKAFEKSFSEADCFGNHFPDVALVAKKGNSNAWGFIDLAGNEVIPCAFSKDLAPEAYRHFLENGKRPWSAEDTHIFNVRNNPARNKYMLTQRLDDSLWDY